MTSRVGIIDLTPFAKFIVKGEDARKYLDYLVAGTVPKEGRGAIQSIVILLKLELYLETSNEMWLATKRVFRPMELLPTH